MLAVVCVSLRYMKNYCLQLAGDSFVGLLWVWIELLMRLWMELLCDSNASWIELQVSLLIKLLCVNSLWGQEDWPCVMTGRTMEVCHVWWLVEWKRVILWQSQEDLLCLMLGEKWRIWAFIHFWKVHRSNGHVSLCWLLIGQKIPIPWSHNLLTTISALEAVHEPFRGTDSSIFICNEKSHNGIWLYQV